MCKNFIITSIIQIFLCRFVAKTKTTMQVKSFKRLPYGTSNFGGLIMENYVYVDKTKFIERLEEEHNPYQFFIRPRKFGKSLFFSMLAHYYDRLRADQFNDSTMGKSRLCIPNYSIQTVFWEYLMEMAQTNGDFSINTTELDQSIAALALDGRAKPFLDYVSKKIFNKLSSRDLRQFDEKYIKIMLFACLFQSRVFIPVSEMETDAGYVDIYLWGEK